MKLQQRARTALAVALALAVGLPVAYSAGTASASSGNDFETSVNAGLVNAFDSVGQNLFGSQAFGATALSLPTSGSKPYAVQLDIVCETPPVDGSPAAFQRIVNIVYPPDPIMPGASCQIGVQLLIDENGVTAVVDPIVAPDFLLTTGWPTGVAFCDSTSIPDLTDG